MFEYCLWEQKPMFVSPGTEASGRGTGAFVSETRVRRNRNRVCIDMMENSSTLFSDDRRGRILLATRRQSWVLIVSGRRRQGEAINVSRLHVTPFNGLLCSGRFRLASGSSDRHKGYSEYARNGTVQHAGTQAPIKRPVNLMQAQ